MLKVFLRNGKIRHFRIPRGTFHTPKHLEKYLYHGILKDLEDRLRQIGVEVAPKFKRSINNTAEDEEEIPESKRAKRQTQPTETIEILDTNEAKDLLFLIERDEWNYAQALEVYLSHYKNEIKATSPNLNEHILRHFSTFKNYYNEIEKSRKVSFSKETAKELLDYAKNIRFIYNEDIMRFELLITDKRISHVQLTPQINYILGFEENISLYNAAIAKYACDLRGSISQLCVYLNSGLIESIIFGETFSNVLQIIAVKG